MATLRDVVSRIRSANKFINENDLLNDRVIASEVRSKAILLIKRESNARRLWNTDTIFTPIPCLQMEEIKLSDCCNYKSDRTISKSKIKLPRIAEGNYQYLISQVSDLDSSVVLKYMPVKRFINMLKLGLRTNEVYYWIQDQYLFVSNPNARSVRISAFFEEDLPFDILYPAKCDCGPKPPDCPDNPLDLEFKCPGYLENSVVEMTSKYLRETYLAVSDIKTEANEDTQKKQ